jgi:hypothetical protein
MPMDTNPWAGVPADQRSITRAFINSENQKDREHARRLCKKYGLDYAAMRAVIMREMVAYEARRLARPAPIKTLFGEER